MSVFLVRKNNESSARLFNKRAYYKFLAASSYNSLTDFAFERFLYGRVDRLFSPIYAPSADNSKFKRIPQAVNSQTNVMAFDFVVDAFNDLAQQFKKAAQTGKIDVNDRYLTNLKVYRAFQNPKERYEKYMSKYMGILKTKTRRRENKIENFEMLKDSLLQSVRVSNEISPYTFSAYVKNRRTPITTSGLSIEIANFDKSNDEVKIGLFVNSKNWGFYQNAAEAFGFMIDINAPWRLVADIGSEQMLKYAAAYGYETTDDVLNGYFSSTAVNDYSNFHQKMYNLYNFVKPPVIQYTEEVNGRLVLRRRFPKDYKTLENFKKHFDEEYMIELYCNLRFLEEETKFSENERKLLIDDTIEIYRATNKFKAIRQFERLVNKPFDYSGSLSYNIVMKRFSEEENENNDSTTGY